AETYVHRIGRTARAGRAGTAILFVTPRESRLLKTIERYTGARIAPMKMPTAADVAARRVTLFKAQLRKAAQEDGLEPYLTLVEELAEEGGLDIAEIAAAAARLASGEKPLVASAEPEAPPELPAADGGMVRLFIDAGRRNGVRPGDIVGAIAGEADIPGHTIGAIDIHDSFTLVEVPSEYVTKVLAAMRDATIRTRPVSVKVAESRYGQEKSERPRREHGGKERREHGGKEREQRAQAPARKERAPRHGLGARPERAPFYQSVKRGGKKPRPAA
ncbi:MAG TPA: DbpA RNA binding domain-containing protein, partial [Terriglobales bacterium]|nr:DbpA RNA binding domain-containing protein [Terriglobales bacterium]